MTGAPPRAIARAVSVVAAVLAPVVLVTGCAGPPAGPFPWTFTSTVDPATGDVDAIDWALYAEPYSLDAAYAFDYADNQVLSNVCESLLRLEPDFSLSPGLATSFSHPDPLTWVYEIREGVTFHDGTPLTAEDVAVSMNRHLDPEVGSSWYSVYQRVDRIEQSGPMQVTVHLATPDEAFNSAMGGAAGVVDSAAFIEAAGADYGNSTGGVNCTGPFELDHWEAGTSLTLSRNDDYWDPDLRAHAETFTFHILTDGNARANALRSGELQGSWMVNPEAYERLEESGVGRLEFGLNTSVSSLIVNDLTGPLGDLRVRRALALALDREGMLSAAAHGVGEVTDALTTTSVWNDAPADVTAVAFEDLTPYPHDLEEAKRLVEEAGATGEEIVFATAPISSEFTIIAQATVAVLQSIGLQARIETLTPSAYTTLFSDPSAREGIDLFFTTWYLSSPDPLEMYSVLRTGDFSNYGGWSDPEFDELVGRAFETADPAERAELTGRLQAIANRELPWIPVYESPTSLFLNDALGGVVPSISYLYHPWAATIGSI